MFKLYLKEKKQFKKILIYIKIILSFSPQDSSVSQHPGHYQLIGHRHSLGDQNFYDGVIDSYISSGLKF